jgi:hypothetical protein
MSITPSGRLLRRSAGDSDRPAIFAAQFALSHACWLIAYPLAGQIGAGFGQNTALAVLAALAAVGTLAAVALWPKGDPQAISHSHSDLPVDHPHHAAHAATNGEHTHDYVIDDVHTRWPSR